MVGEQLGRRAAVLRDTRLVLGHLLGEVDVQRGVVLRAQAPTMGIWSAGTARTEWIAAPMTTPGLSSRRNCAVLTAQASADPSE